MSYRDCALWLACDDKTCVELGAELCNVCQIRRSLELDRDVPTIVPVDELETLKHQINWLWDWATGRTSFRPHRFGWTEMQLEMFEQTGQYWNPIDSVMCDWFLDLERLTTGERG